jgi:uroporphyrinogen decarboxylase
MNSRERIFTTLEHREPDKVPFDFAGMHCTGIHVKAYEALCVYMGINPEPIRFLDVIQQVVIPKQELLEKLHVDTRGLYPLCSHNWRFEIKDIGDCYEYTDEWGFTHHFPKNNGFWWCQTRSPLSKMRIEAEVIHNHDWPHAYLPERIKGLRTFAQQYRDEGKIVMLKGFCAGLFEMGQRIRGMENFLCDLMMDRDNAGLLLDKILELKKQFWIMALEEFGDLVDIVVEVDDYGIQESQLISYEIFEELIAPRLHDLTRFLKTTLAQNKKLTEKGYVFASIHNIQADVPPTNIMAMWEALQEYGQY